MFVIFLFFIVFSSFLVANEDKRSSLRDKLTIITATSPIKSNPRTDIIEATQKSLFLIPELRDCKKIIVFDGVNDQGYTENPKSIEQVHADYAQFKYNVTKLTEDPSNPYFKNTTLLFVDEWKHLAWSLQDAMKLVDTPFVYVHQHDIAITRPFDVFNIIRTMEDNPNIKLIRAPFGENYPNWFDGPVDDKIEGLHYVPLVSTFRFSDPEHFTTVQFYKEFIFSRVKVRNYPECAVMAPDFKAMQEEIIKNHNQWGMYIYGSLYEKTHLNHLDGRKSD